MQVAKLQLYRIKYLCETLIDCINVHHVNCKRFFIGFSNQISLRENIPNVWVGVDSVLLLVGSFCSSNLFLSNCCGIDSTNSFSACLWLTVQWFCAELICGTAFVCQMESNFCRLDIVREIPLLELNFCVYHF